MKYTEDDLIWSIRDSKLIQGIGKQVIYGNTPYETITDANNNAQTTKLIGIRADSAEPFITKDGYWPCIIIKKEEKDVR